MNILGLNAVGHDTSSTLIKNGHVISACEQERYDLQKHSRNFPTEAVNDCLKIAGKKIEFHLNLKFIAKFIFRYQNQTTAN